MGGALNASTWTVAEPQGLESIDASGAPRKMCQGNTVSTIPMIPTLMISGSALLLLRARWGGRLISCLMC